MKPNKSQIAKLVSAYRPGNNDFAPSVYTVCDYSNVERKVEVERLRRWTQESSLYWEERGYEIIDVDVTETGDRFLPYKVTMKHPRKPKLIEFKQRYQAEKYARENFSKLWAAYQDFLNYSLRESSKRYLKEIGYAATEIESIMNQAANLTGKDLDEHVNSFAAAKIA